MQDQYIEMSTAVAEDAALYGLGERTSSTGLELQRNGVPLALWNRDHQAALPDQNVYGSHPILMDVRAGAPRCIASPWSGLLTPAQGLSLLGVHLMQAFALTSSSQAT